MPAQLTLFPVRGASRAFVWNEGRSQFAGREPESDICLDDPRVSGRHALFQWSGGGWLLVDLRSKNGTYVNGLRVSEVPLQSGDWISFGGLLARHEQIREADVRALEDERTARRARCAILRGSLASEAVEALDGFWVRLLAAALELVGASRGFAVFAAPGEVPSVRTSWGYAPFETVDEVFDPVVAAVASILRDGKQVASMRRGEIGERRRGTLEELGAGAMAAVALPAGGRVGGALCVEGRRRGGAFTEFELELLEEIAGSASATMVTSGTSGPSRIETPRPRETAPGAGRPFVEQLDRRLADAISGQPEPAPQSTREGNAP